MGANGSGKSTLVRALTGLLPLTAGSLELFGTPFDDFTDWRRIGFVPQRVGAASGVPASVWEVVASGRLTRRRLLRPLSQGRPARDRRGDRRGRAHRQGPRRCLPALRRPAAADADRAGAGRRAGAVLPRRAHRRRRPAQPAHPGDVAEPAQGARRHDRARRPRARPAGRPRGPLRGDARRPGGLRRRAARRPRRAPPGLRRAARAPPPSRPVPARPRAAGRRAVRAVRPLGSGE